MQIKPLAAQAGGPERYRVVLSDINNFVQSMLATSANHVIHEGKLKKGSFVRLKSYQANAVKGKRILIVLELEVIESLGEHEKLGDPQALQVVEDTAQASKNEAISGSGFYGNQVKQETQQERNLPSRAVANNASSGAHQNIYPIESLSPYAHKWTIRARVTSKSEIKTWHKQSGEGKLFSVNLMDDSSEIRATGFNDQCDQLYELLQENQVYYITSPCRVQLAKKQFSNLPNDYELTFERDTIVEKCEDQESVPQVRYNFTSFAEIESVDAQSTVDVIGILKEVADVTQIVSKTTSKPYDKRELTLVDDTGFSMRMTIWGKTALTFDSPPESVAAFKGCKVSDFGGRTLSLLSSGSMLVDPDIPEAHKLRGWYDKGGKSQNFNSHSNMMSTSAAGGNKDPLKTVAQIKDENLGMNDDKPDYFSIKATVVYIKQDNCSYPACLSDGCNKKVTDMGDGTWRCEKCDIAHPKPEHRWIMSLNVNDHTGQLWLSCFDDVGKLIMGMSADKMMEYRENDEAALTKAFEDANCKTMIFKVRAKMDTFQDQQKSV